MPAGVCAAVALPLYCFVLVFCTFGYTKPSSYMRKFTYLLVCVMLLGQAPVFAQSSNVGDAIEDGVGKVVQGLFGKKKKKKEEETEPSEDAPADTGDEGADAREAEEQRKAMAMMQSMFGGGEDVKIEEVYVFDGRVEGTMTNTNKKGKESTSDITSYFSKSKEYFAFEPEEDKKGNTGLIIFDPVNKAMVTLVEDDQKMAMVIPMDWDAAVDAAAEEEGVEGRWEKTGRTKTIAGYAANEYKGTHQEYETSFWVAEDPALEGLGLFGGLFRMDKKKKATQQLFEGMPSGMVMEATSLNTETGEKSFWLVNSVDMSHSSDISTAGYQVMSLGNMGGMMQQMEEQQPNNENPKNEPAEGGDDDDDEY